MLDVIGAPPTASCRSDSGEEDDEFTFEVPDEVLSVGVLDTFCRSIEEEVDEPALHKVHVEAPSFGAKEPASHGSQPIHPCVCM